MLTSFILYYDGELIVTNSLLEMLATAIELRKLIHKELPAQVEMTVSISPEYLLCNATILSGKLTSYVGTIAVIRKIGIGTVLSRTVDGDHAKNMSSTSIREFSKQIITGKYPIFQTVIPKLLSWCKRWNWNGGILMAV